MTQKDEWYYRIKESFRDVLGRPCHRLMLTVGFLKDELAPTDIRDIGRCLTWLHENQHQQDLFGDAMSNYKAVVRRLALDYWHQMVENGNVDAVKRTMEQSRQEAEHFVDVDTIEHTDAREVGAEWICLQAIRELQLDTFLQNEGWNETQINTTLAHLIVRMVYSSSEHKSLDIMRDNSAVCELLTGDTDWQQTYHSIYNVAPSLYALKEKLDNHLCRRTDNLFNITNRIVLFDLTNFYFEGRKDGSKKAQFGRSKEKRSDCKLLVLALCINQEGFIRYSSILAGNTSDPASLPDMIDTLSSKSHVHPTENQRVLVCLDAGIVTEDNLVKIKERGYDYLCVSRNRLTDYEIENNGATINVKDSKNKDISLTRVKHEEGGDYYLEIYSPQKELKESSMNRQFRERFETELLKTKASLGKKGGKKKYEKVIERVGRAIQKYPSIARYYVIEYERDKSNEQNMLDIKWHVAIPDSIDSRSGIYFLRTNREQLEEKTTWEYYNLIREIECTNRQLKTDLNLRPIYHQKDENSDAHLYLGLLAYQIVNTIRYKLKQTGETCYWTEIKRRMMTQKAVTTEAVNALGEKIQLRLCSTPTKVADDIYERLKYKKMPFYRLKIPPKEKVCSTQ